jgi:hypothetical protein
MLQFVQFSFECGFQKLNVKMKSFKFLILFIVSLTQWASASTCDTLVSEGRSFLTTSNLLWAKMRFGAAVWTCPDHPTANVLYGITRIAVLPLEPGGSNFLTHLGIPAQGRNLYNWTAKGPQDTNGSFIIPTGINGSEFVLVIRTNLLPTILGAETNLSKVTDTNFLLTLSRGETIIDDVTLDYGDILMLRAMLHAAEFVAYTVNDWNLDAQSSLLRAFQTNGLLSVQKVFAQYPDLLKFSTTNDLHAAETALRNAIDRYTEASSFIRARPPEAQRLFNYDLASADSEQSFRLTLADLKTSLARSVVLCTQTNYTVHLGEYFTGKHSWRSFLPDFVQNRIVIGSLPDATFGGMLGGVSEAALDYKMAKGLKTVTRMDGYLEKESGQYICQFSTVTGHVYSLQASSDLVQWTEVVNFFSEGGKYGYVDGAQVTRPYRYYWLRDEGEPHFVTVAGRVLAEPSREPLAGAHIMTSLDGCSTTTDSNGFYRLETRTSADQISEYVVYATHPGYSMGGRWVTSDPAYDIDPMNLEIQMWPIPTGAPAGAVTILAPTDGTAFVIPEAPVLVWSQGLPRATWFNVMVLQDYYVYTNFWMRANTLSTTNVFPLPNLGSGTYTWYIQPWNAGGFGPSSAARSFYEEWGVPGAVSLISPMYAIQTNSTITYTWTLDPRATGYELLVDRENYYYFGEYLELSDLTINGTNASVQVMGHYSGDYEWYVCAYNPYYTGPWSSEGAFTVNLPHSTTPGLVTLISPLGTNLTNSVVNYTWALDPEATEYEIYISSDEGFYLDNNYPLSALTVNGNNASVQIGSHTTGYYYWWVRGYNPIAYYNYGPWSYPGTFRVWPNP